MSEESYLKAFIFIASIANDAEDISALLKAADRVRDVFDASRCAILVRHDLHGMNLDMAVDSGAPEDASLVGRSFSLHDFPGLLDTQVVRPVARPKDDPLTANLGDFWPENGFDPLVIVSMRVQGNWRGMMWLAMSSELSPEKAQFLSVIGGLLAGAFDNIIHHEQIAAYEAQLAESGGYVQESRFEQSRANDAFLEIVKTVTSRLNEEDMLNALVTQAAEVLRAHRVFVGLLDKEKPSELQLIAGHSRDGRFAFKGRTIDLNDFPEAQDALSNETLRMIDAQEHPFLKPQAELFDLRYRLLMPLCQGSERLGVLSVDLVGDIEEPQLLATLSLVEAIASLATGALLHFKSLERLFARDEQIAAIYETSQTLAQSDNMFNTIDSILHAVIRATGAYEVIVYNHDGEQIRPSMGRRRGRPNSMRAPVSRLMGLANKVVEEGKLNLRRSPDLPVKGLKTALGVPLQSVGGLVGVMTLGFDTAIRLDEHMLHLVQLLAQQAAVALNHVRLLEAERDYVRRLEKALQQHVSSISSEKMRNQLLLNALPDAVIVMNSEGKADYANPAFENLTGYNVEDITGQVPPVLQCPHVPDSVYRDMWRTVRAGHIWRGMMRAERKDRTPYDIDLAIAPVFGKNREILYFLASCRNATAFREADLSRAKFVRTIVQELGSPFDELLSDVERMIKWPTGLGTGLEKLQNDLSFLGRLAQDSLLLASLEAGHSIGQLEPVDLPGIALNAADDLRSELSQKNISVSPRLSFNIPEVMGSPERLRQVMDAILLYALHTTPEGGRIAIRSGVELGGVYISVYHSGDGLSAEEQRRVFLAFNRDPVRPEDGILQTGLEMALAKFIVEAHGGTMRVTSDDKGTTFTFEIPVAKGGTSTDELQLPGTGTLVSGVKDKKDKDEGAQTDQGGGLSSEDIDRILQEPS